MAERARVEADATDVAEADRLALAEALLQEAVFRSRAKQAAGLGSATSATSTGPTGAGCGLGARAAVEAELSEEGSRLLARLWPEPPGEAELGRIGTAIAGWVRLQDALDRKRNHFLKDFRGRHGADRRAYPPEVARAFEQGLAEVNGEVDQRRARAARELLGEGPAG